MRKIFRHIAVALLLSVLIIADLFDGKAGSRVHGGPGDEQDDEIYY